MTARSNGCPSARSSPSAHIIRGGDSLKGTTMTIEQIADLAAVFARSLGIRTD
ncbi:MAG: hypothetical protein U0N15_03990 [Bifidobacterium choerinum]